MRTLVVTDLSGANTPLPDEALQAIKRLADGDRLPLGTNVRCVDSKPGLVRSTYNSIVSEWRTVLARQSDVVWLHNIGPLTTARKAGPGGERTEGTSHRIRQGFGENGVRMSLLFDWVALSEASRVVISIDSPRTARSTLRELVYLCGRLPKRCSLVAVGSENEGASHFTPALLDRLDTSLHPSEGSFSVNDLLQVAEAASPDPPIVWGPVDTTLI